MFAVLKVDSIGFLNITIVITQPSAFYHQSPIGLPNQNLTGLWFDKHVFQKVWQQD